MFLLASLVNLTVLVIPSSSMKSSSIMTLSTTLILLGSILRDLRAIELNLSIVRTLW